jgi:prophage regulatory protein
MIQKYPVGAQCADIPNPLNVVRHNQVRKKLNVSSAKLFDMIARGQFPKPFSIVPNGRAVGWLEAEVDEWIMERKNAMNSEGI